MGNGKFRGSLKEIWSFWARDGRQFERNCAFLGLGPRKGRLRGPLQGNWIILGPGWEKPNLEVLLKDIEPFWGLDRERANLEVL